ncbi:Asp23/Gls24 family envelope stress response protein [Microbacterium sp.]|uniref:Asp23/Gls24 family envelope stress response protein n=1 Tax=Microbacterium sp. TaxID=51671 RepID=UPI0025E8EF91|nr:Asp23/Gls24 family envelope stress response protein [Microbacterium sp.]
MGDGIGESGYTLEDLAAYHDRGRVPADPAIDGDPQCCSVLDSMDHLGMLSRNLLESDSALDLSESWLQKILGQVARESRAGRDMPMEGGGDVQLVVTEGAVRGLVRAAGDRVPGVLVERVEVLIDGAAPDGARTVSIALSISVLHGLTLPTVAGDVRNEVRRALLEHTTWAVDRVDVTIDSLRLQGESR